MAALESDLHDFSRKFCECGSFRELVLGTSQFAVDLCAALQLPLNVVTTSLLFLQQFLSNFDIYGLELPLVCGACVLLAWKYWEDFDNDMRSVRKLNDISRQIFKLLVFPIDDSEDEEEPNGKPADTAETDRKQQRWRGQLEKLPASTWTLRDEGKEFNRVKNRVKLYESSLLRCISFEVGPTLSPLDEVQSLAQFLWVSEQRGRNCQTEEEDRNCETPMSLPAMPPQCLTPASDSSASGSSRKHALDSCDEGASPQAKRPRLSATSHSSALSEDSLTSSASSAYQPELPLISTPPSSKLQASCVASEAQAATPPALHGRSESSIQAETPIADPEIQMQKFQLLLLLSQSLVIDYYRSPFCLLSDPISIAVASVWKASVITGFRHVNLETVVKRLRKPIVVVLVIASL